MGEQLSEEALDSYKRLLIADVCEILPGNANNAPPNVSDEELARLLMAASRLALSNDSADKTMAYEIATRIVELDRKTQSGFIDIAEIVLARLGNFPGRELLRKRYASNQTERKLPLCFTLETCAREFENTVEAGEGHVVTLTDFQHDLFSALQNSSAVSASAPTSAGKSFVLSLDIIRRLRRTPHCSVVYVVPTRALIRQVMLSIVKDLNAAGLQDVPVRCVPIPIEHSKAVDGVVYVLTQERLMSLLHSEEGTPWVSVLIVDEAQGIKDGARGILLHSAIDAVFRLFPKVEVLFASPQTKNPEYLLDLFERRESGKKLCEEHSPVSQNLVLVNTVRGKVVNFKLFTKHQILDLGNRDLDFNFSSVGVSIRRAKFARDITRDGDSTIIYANRAKDTETFAEKLVEGLPDPDDVDEEIQEFVEFLQEHIHEDYNLIRILRHRVAFHYGYMPSNVRSRVEDLFASGKLQFICCTSTLLQGVNLPAKNLVIENPHRGGGNPMDRGDFLNLAGRAGRLLKEFHGTVWCLQSEKWDSKSFEGETLQSMRSAFEEVLMDGGSVISKVLDGTASSDEIDLGTAAVGKVFIEFTQSGKRLENSKYRNDRNETGLKVTADRVAEIKVELPKFVFESNPMILPSRLQELFKFLDEELDPRVWMPLLPHESNSNIRMREIFQLVNVTLRKIENNSFRYHAMLASKWIHDVTLKRIIEEAIAYQRQNNQFVSVRQTIFDLMEDLEKEIRFQYVKHTRAFSDVLSVVLRRAGYHDLAVGLKPLHLFLECGASNRTVLSLIALGLSRTTALLLKGKLRFGDDYAPEDCLAKLAATDLSSLKIPGVCLKEIRELLRT
jgi:superfamily II DNA/RNA helicase